MARIVRLDELAKDLIEDNSRLVASGLPPRFTWEEPLLFAVDVRLGPTGLPEETFSVTATVGARIETTAANASLQLFGLGTANVSGQDMGAIGALLNLKLNDPDNSSFTLAFATPDPASDFSGNIPASVLLGARFETIDNGIQLTVQGEVVIETAAIASIKGNTVPEIADRLARLRENVIGLNTEKIVDSQEVTLLADKTVPFEIIKMIMSTSTSEGYGKISLAVLQKSTQLASAE